MFQFCKPAISLIEYIEQHGYFCYLVGGAVRDSILDIEPKDYDFVTDANLLELEAIFKDYGFKIYSNKITASVKFEGKHFEITPIIGSSLEEDILRRDFTINSILYNPKTGFIDRCNGILDLKNRIIRAIDLEDVFSQPIRILRALRLSAIYHFKIDDKLEEKIKNSISLIPNIPSCNISKEIIFILNNDCYQLFLDYEDILSKVLLIDELDINSLRYSKNILEVRLAILYRNTMNVEDILTDLRISKDTIKIVIKLIKGLDIKIDNEKNIIYSFGVEHLDYFFYLKEALDYSNRILYEDLYQKSIKLIDNNELIFVKDLNIKPRSIYKLGFLNNDSKIIIDDLLDKVRNGVIPNDFDSLRNYIIETYKNN